MLRYTLGRIGQTLATLVLSSFVVFAIVHVLPGSPANVIAGPDATQATIQAVTRSLGLNRPLPVQYADWVWQLLHGNMGRSFIYGTSAASLIFSRLPWSLVLAAAGLVIAVAVAVPAGLFAATREGGRIDAAVSGISAAMIGIPGFVFGIVLIYVFAVTLRLFPVPGGTSFEQNAGLAARSIVLPACALAIEGAATLVRFTRATVREALASQFIQTARAKGAMPFRVLFRHALPSTAVPLVTMIGVVFGRTLAGGIIIEQVFAWPGNGQLLLQAITDRDYAVVQGSMLIVLLILLAMNLVTDLCYGALDPRVRVRAR